MKNNNIPKSERALKNVERIRGFYNHLTAWIILNTFLFVGPAILPGIHPDFWDVSFAVVFILGGLGVAGHFMGVFGFRLLFSEARERKALHLAFSQINNETTKTNPDMENTITEQQLKAERARRRVKALKGFYQHLAAYIVVNIALLVTTYYKAEYLHNEQHEFWSFQTFSTAIFWGIGLLCHAFNTFGTNILLGSGWEERKIQEYMNKDKHTKGTHWE